MIFATLPYRIAQEMRRHSSDARGVNTSEADDE
jgi:hypothetical protein